MVDTIAPTVQHLTEQQCRALDADFDTIVNGLAAAKNAAAIVSLDRAADLLDQIGTRIAGLAYGLRHASTELTTTAQHCPSGVRAASGVVVPASLAGPERPGEAG